MSTGKQRPCWMAFAGTLACFVIANLIAVGTRSDAGLLEGLGILDHAQDDIRRIGFPFQFFEEGGFSYRHIFSLRALALDLTLAFFSAAGVAFAWYWLYDFLSDQRV